jgi:hypothetical protein
VNSREDVRRGITGLRRVKRRPPATIHDFRFPTAHFLFPISYFLFPISYSLPRRGQPFSINFRISQALTTRRACIQRSRVTP